MKGGGREKRGKLGKKKEKGREYEGGRGQGEH